MSGCTELEEASREGNTIYTFYFLLNFIVTIVEQDN